jgi:chemotaxis methyl-accepting protein methylase
LLIDVMTTNKTNFFRGNSFWYLREGFVWTQTPSFLGAGLRVKNLFH